VNDRSVICSPLRLFVLLLGTLALAPPGAGAAAPKPAPPPPTLPIFRADSAVVEADELLQWRINFAIVNRFPVGIYCDTFVCEIQNLDPGETHAERTKVLDFSFIVSSITVSAGDSAAFTFTSPASVEHGRLRFRLGLHRADKSRTSLTTVVEAMPGTFSRDHPSQFLTVNGRRLEYVVFRAAHDSVPGLLLVHGRGGNARTVMRTALRVSSLGYTVLAPSMPGFGQSEGPPDVVGTLTVQALGAALDQLKATQGVDPKRIGAWGASTGAAAVTLLALSRADLKATVAESGFYDLWSVYRALKDPDLRESIVRGAGSDSSGWRARSAALNPGKPTSILILHGEKDLGVPAQQAHGFAESLKARGGDVETRFFPNSGHELPPGDVTRAAIEYLDRKLGN
jgi:dipeptidyl aminopeptidase/acylaminoacyl peptidase